MATDPNTDTKPNSCFCCGAQLHEIDPENICMDCVDIGCNINDKDTK